jgi:serine protease Do
MRHAWMRSALLVAVISGQAGTEAQAQYSRRTPIVEAVQKTRAGIVTIRVAIKDSAGRERERVGTGIIVDERGYVVTSLHVVATGDNIRVHLVDGTTCTAQVLKEDSNCDLAVLRIPANKKLQALPLGPANDLLVGETVIAVGHPFGYTNTVSTGIISAVGREVTLPSGELLSHLIQTNASINPGNSGGPLLNINGELIGINVALREGAQGIAFAINADTLQEALCRHLSALELAGVEHGLACSEAIAPEGLHRQRVLVASVDRQTPAAAAGLERGDEILRVAERCVCNRFDVERAFWDHKPGEQVNLTVVRQGKERSLRLTLARGAAGEQTVVFEAATGKGTASTTRAAGRKTAQER